MENQIKCVRSLVKFNHTNYQFVEIRIDCIDLHYHCTRNNSGHRIPPSIEKCKKESKRDNLRYTY